MKILAKSSIKDKDGKDMLIDASIRTHYSPLTGEAIKSNAIGIVSVNWNRAKSTCLVGYALGGYAPSGDFHADSQYPIGHYQFSRQYTRKLWEEMKMDDITQVTEDALLEALGREPAIQMAVSKWKLSGISFVMDE